MIELHLFREDFLIQGPTRGSTKRFQILFFQFGQENSFLRAERAALEANGSTVLISRLRLRNFEGLVIPTSWFAVLGMPFSDLPIIGWERYHAHLAVHKAQHYSFFSLRYPISKGSQHHWHELTSTFISYS